MTEGLEKDTCVLAGEGMGRRRQVLLSPLPKPAARGRAIKRRVWGLLPALLLAACGDGSPSQPEPDPDPGAFPRDTVLADVPTCPGGSALSLMDIRFPSADVGDGAPMALHLHGGAWIAGDKGDGPWYEEVAAGLLDRGFVVATASYRLAPAHAWPAQIHDAKCAVRHLRARAAEYGGDPDRIVVWGHSAGGHLASMLGVTGADAGFGGAGFSGVSSAVSGVVSIAGITDLPPLSGNFLLSFALNATFGTSNPASPVLRDASPVTWVSAGDPPHLLVHGDRDPLIPVSQATGLRDGLARVSVRGDLIRVVNGGHSLEATGGAPSPGAAETRDRILAFMSDVTTAK